jgi:post-segregation antitoxin (ccd killing protein)
MSNIKIYMGQALFDAVKSERINVSEVCRKALQRELQRLGVKIDSRPEQRTVRPGRRL